MDLGHRMDFKNTKVLCRTSDYRDRIVKEAIAISLEKKSINRDKGFQLSSAWNAIVNRYIRTQQRRTALYRDKILPYLVSRRPVGIGIIKAK